jgi:hypothetical protein
MFDQAKLAIVAYGEVSGTDGSSTKTNSGVVTTRLGLGTFQISLPNGSALQPQLLEQFSDRDLIFIQPLHPTAPIATSAVNDANRTNKLVFLGSSATTAVDCDFSFLILRTVTPPTLGGPA